MRDFTLSAYKRYMEAVQSSYSPVLRVDEYFLSDPVPETFCIIRHDVDRRPKKALRMARLEHEMNIRATYYFRSKPHVFKPDIIKEIAGMGHEIGYHYESLSDAKGDMRAALMDFEENLTRFREMVAVRTIAMHGRPLSPFDNSDLWRSVQKKKLLSEKYRIICEVYLDIDYTEIAYITDTGRNWHPSRANRRDRVESRAAPYLKNGDALHQFFRRAGAPKIVFQVHPERWAESLPEYLLVASGDYAANLFKRLAL